MVNKINMEKYLIIWISPGLVLAAIFRDSNIAASVLGEAWGGMQSTAAVLVRALKLAATLVDVAGAPLLPL